MKSLIHWNLPPKRCICIHDYSENYRCVEKNEIQSNYFQRTESVNLRFVAVPFGFSFTYSYLCHFTSAAEEKTSISQLKGTATKRRLTLVRKVTKVGEMFDYFKTLLETFPAHQHRANWHLY
jgi:hypothetical protein